MVESPSLFVPLTVILEFEWVMRGFYNAAPASFCQAVEHLLGMPHVTVERWQSVKDALGLHLRGLDFAHALQGANSSGCERPVTFDDRGFVRRARRLELAPEVTPAK
jgi:predicted nucleic-acid-binding protein